MDEEKKMTQLEMARIIGEPRDPRKPYSLLVDRVCETDTADPDEYVYYFDALLDTDKVYVITSTGAITQENVAPDTPAAMTFFDVASPEYFIKFIDLASAKERVISRKVQTINRAMNTYENYKIMTLIAAAVPSANNFSLDSSYEAFNYKNLVDMIDSIKDYSDNYTLIAGTTIDKDILLWDWTDNKYMSLKEAFSDLGVDTVRINQTVTVDGSPVDVLASTKAYLVGKDTEMGKPLLFVRKKLDTINALGGIITQDGSMPERFVYVSPNPITVTGSARYLAYGMTGFEEAAAAVTNSYALSYFNRV